MTTRPDVPERELIPYETSVFEARSVLVLAPHPDDEVFGCGAALASLNAAGTAVHLVLVTDGAGDEPDAGARLRTAEARRAESRAALDALGGGTLETWDFPDRGLAARLRDVERAVAGALVAARPELVFVPSPAEVHPDHRALSEAFLNVAAAWPGGDEAVRALESATVAFYEVSQPIRPNFLLDATRHWDAVERAMAAFPSQNRERDYGAFIRGLAAYRRMTLPPEVTAAEAFFVLPARELRVRSLLELRRRLGPTEESPSLLGRILDGLSPGLRG